MKTYLTPLRIPEGKSGKVMIRHEIKPAGEKVMLGNMRTRFIGRQSSEADNLIYDAPTKWHYLEEEGQGTWMTDLPIEQRQHDDLLKPIRSGSVLIGGLGLGYAATVLAKRKHISRITVVEISQDVVKLVAPSLKSTKIEVVCDDLHHYLKTTKEKFDWAYYDIWQSDGEYTFFHTVCPLFQESADVIKRRPVCWNEDVMRGQLWHGLSSRQFMVEHDQTGKKPEEVLEFLTTPGDIWVNWSIPFFRWYRDKKPSEMHWQRQAQLYAKYYGTGKWNPVPRLYEGMEGENDESRG